MDHDFFPIHDESSLLVNFHSFLPDLNLDDLMNTTYNI
jgi:hypothetical protein